MRNLKEFIKNFLIKLKLLNVAKYCFNICLTIRSLKCRFMKKIRGKGYIDKKYANLLKYKDIHNNERCFIVATGPSLLIQDIEKLKGEITFSMNSIINVFTHTEWRPTYYGIQDGIVYHKLCNNPLFLEIKNKFIGDWMIDKLYFDGIAYKKLPCDSILFPTDMLNHRNYKAQNFKIDFSDNAYAIVYEGATITYSLMQIAVYMGFSEIYLLGCDCDYSGEKQHFDDYGDRVRDDIGNNMIIAYNKAKEFADKHNVKIYNATRGGKLNVFDRVDFDSLFTDLSEDK